jgi:hypothetical protein
MSDQDDINIEELEHRMRPGVFSTRGFLGEKEKLEDILNHDREILESMGVSFSEIGNSLANLLNAAIASKNRYENDMFVVKLKLFPGFQICPWSKNPHQEQCSNGGGVQFGSVDWLIFNKLLNASISGSGLIVHLIRDHHFFEGLQSPYRADPIDLIKVLGIKHGKSNWK